MIDIDFLSFEVKEQQSNDGLSLFHSLYVMSSTMKKTIDYYLLEFCSADEKKSKQQHQNTSFEIYSCTFSTGIDHTTEIISR